MAATNNLVVKITYGTEIRRFTSNADNLSNWKDLGKRIKTLFDLSHKTFKLTYTDDEGDFITISSDEELSEAAGCALSLSPAVLRLTVNHVADQPAALDKSSTTTTDAASTATNDVPMEDAADDKTHQNNKTAPDGTTAADPLAGFIKTLAGQLPQVLSQMPEGVRNLIPRAELDVAATLAANAADNASCIAADARKAMEAMAGAAAAAAAAKSCPFAPCELPPGITMPPKGVAPIPGAHAGVTCDKSGMCPIVGNRYHLVGHNYDVCEAEYMKLDDKEKALFQKIPPASEPAPPIHIGNTTTPPTKGVHPGVTCDKSGMCPIVGNRYHLVGHNYDVCEAEYMKLDDKEKAHFQKIAPPLLEDGVHPGVECDRSGMCPIVGIRYNLRGHDFDLCQAEFDKLPAAEKHLYTAIAPPAMGNGGHRGPFGRGNHPWGGQRGGGWNGGCGWGRGMSRHGMNNNNNNNNAENGNNGNNGGCGPGGKLAARFVRDVTIFDGTQISPGIAFTKIWRLKNVGEVPWPPGTKMLFVGGDQMTTEMAVPLSRSGPVMPGEEVDVAVEMTAPSDLGRYLGYWRLIGPRGRKFGQRVWCHVQVIDPTSEVLPDFAAAEEDLKKAQDEIAKKKTDLTAKEQTEDGGNDDGHDDDGHDDGNGDGNGDGDGANLDVVAAEVVDVSDATKDTDNDDKDTDNKSTAGKDDKSIVVDAVPLGQPLGGSSEEEATEDDGAKSDDSDAVMVDAPPPPPKDDKGKALADPVEAVRASLGSMGFDDKPMVDAVLSKHGADLEACARDLAAASEWASLLDDLEDMGFADRALNKVLMLKHAGNLKRTVKELVEDLS